jgi:triacylglycerol lipase
MLDYRQTHIVLVPGFGGFDALGQIEYYAGVTPVFEEWAAEAPPGAPASRATLRYFDNFPTAAVKTRADKLHDYLAKRIARREFQPGDRIALIGHSTGGLDIRQLLVDLASAGNQNGVRRVDGDADRATAVREADLHSRIQRLVFLSVPQRGTNIADCVKAYEGLVHGEIRLLGLGVKAGHAAALARVEHLLERWNPPSAPHILLAARDALVETLDPRDPTDRYAAALAREAYFELTSFLANVSSDFLAIDDLAAAGPTTTPARYDQAARAVERAAWPNEIRTRSFATIGRPPFDRPPKTSLRGGVRHWPGLLEELGHLDQENRTDATYRLAYASCASGPFQGDGANDWVRNQDGTRRPIEPWENDGIVNTASMLWPDGPATTLVHADHGDIIGHYRLSGEASGDAQRAPTARVQHTYDILKSSSGFDEAQFKAVWREAFTFCTAP